MAANVKGCVTSWKVYNPYLKGIAGNSVRSYRSINEMSNTKKLINGEKYEIPSMEYP